jgi:hypothetical protein
MQNINRILKDQALLRLVQPDNFVGWVYYIDYDRAFVMTNDLWKAKACGIPHNCFLVAATFNPDEFSETIEEEREVILLRVVGSAKLPQDDDLIRTKIDNYQQQTGIYGDTQARDYDDITRNQLQFGGLDCHVLGTFYQRDSDLWLGSDLESFATASRLNVYRPRNQALQLIVNHIDPLRRQKALEDAQQLGIEKPTAPFRIGTVRYTSTDRLHRREADDQVPVHIQPSDFLARRTAVLGMTRTGKSNMVKQTVSVVKRIADESGIPIGQIIYDVNGEYANANQQDVGAIADVYPDDTVRYRMLETAGFEDLRNNFYEQLNEGFAIIKRELEDANRVTSDYIRLFTNMSLDEPDKQEWGEHMRWEVRVAAYKALLYKAGFNPPPNHRVTFTAGSGIRDAVAQSAGKSFDSFNRGSNTYLNLTLSQAEDWFLAARAVNGDTRLKSSTGKDWVDDTLQNLLDMLAQKNKGTNNFISGYRILSDAIKFHSPRRNREVTDEIYEHLAAGRIVILDLSVGDAAIREKISKQVASKIFNRSMQQFIDGKLPPNIVVYIEEAHNLIGRKHDLTETWPRLAKEGAKYRIALVYATQEVSSVHPNILANTENWFITHLNNDREIQELAHFYDFDDFSRSLIRAQDVGFARVKTLSGPFVIPVQIDKFDPQAESERQRARGTTAMVQAGGEKDASWDDLIGESG